MQPNISGFLKSRSQWNEQVAEQLARQEGITLTDNHWDVIHFIRTEFYSNGGFVPLDQKIRFNMENQWRKDVNNANLLELFPEGANKQGAKIAGCISLRTVDDLLKIKGDRVWSVQPDQPVIDALALMSEKNIGAVMVVDNEQLVGLISERDCTRDIVKEGFSPAEKKVEDLMTENVVSVALSETLDQCMSIMTEKGFRHLPVLMQSQVVGVLSMPDLVRIIVEQQQFTISQLESQTLELQQGYA